MTGSRGEHPTVYLFGAPPWITLVAIPTEQFGTVRYFMTNSTTRHTYTSVLGRTPRCSFDVLDDAAV